MNTQNSILLVDPTFTPSNSPNCSLLIRVGIDSFSYAILDKQTNAVSAVFDEQECDDPVNNLRERVKSDAYLGLAFGEVKLAVYTENDVCVPNSFHENDDLKSKTTFFNQASSGNIYETAHNNFGFTSVFAVSKITDEIIDQSLAGAKRLSPHAALLKLAENGADTALMLDFTAGAMYVLYVKQKQVVFQHGYEVADVEEFNYYLLLMMNLLAIQPNDTEVYISGIIHKEDDKYGRLRDYFNRVNFLNYVNPSLNLQVLDDMPSHYYTTLLALDQCE
ncbi:MAG: DUF3822 family protein [Chitinophagaceae bacterium]|nr:MAG: DUF3822 family protein [Chitinophagaceae bacterium]